MYQYMIVYMLWWYWPESCDWLVGLQRCLYEVLRVDAADGFVCLQSCVYTNRDVASGLLLCNIFLEVTTT